MTIGSEVNRNTYTGNGSTTTFDYTFRIDNAADMQVWLDGVLQTIGFFVTGTGTEEGGTVEFITAPGVDVEVVLRRDQRQTQEYDYTAYDTFPAEDHENNLDVAAMGRIQLLDQLGRAISAPLSDPPLNPLPRASVRANSTLVFDANGQPVAGTGVLPGTVFVSPFGEQLVAEPDAAGVRGLIEIVEPSLVNFVVDGEMEWAQEFGSSNPQSGSGFATDAFALSRSGWGGSQTHERRDVSDSPQGELNDAAAIHARSVHVIAASGYTPASNERTNINHAIEGRDVIRWRVGRPNPTTINISFWVKASKPGIGSVCLLNNDASRAYVTAYNVNAADTWEFKDLGAIVLDDSGTWPTGDSAVGLFVQWFIGTGPGLQTSDLNQWIDGQAGSPNVRRAALGQENWGENTNDYFALSGVQVIEADRFVGFHRRTQEQIYDGVARRYQKTYQRNVFPGAVTDNGVSFGLQSNPAPTGNLYNLAQRFSRMRVNPLVQWRSPTTGALNTVRDVTAGADLTVSSTLRGNDSSTGYPVTAVVANGNLLWAHWVADARI